MLVLIRGRWVERLYFLIFNFLFSFCHVYLLVVTFCFDSIFLVGVCNCSLVHFHMMGCPRLYKYKSKLMGFLAK